MNRETRRLILGSAAGIGAALAAHYALTAHQHPTRRPANVPPRPQSGEKDGGRPMDGAVKPH